MPAVDRYRWKDRRAELDIDTEAAAEELGISKRTLQNIETTAGYPVKLRVIYRAARLYRCSATWLRGGDDAPPQEEPKPKRPPSGDPKGPDPRRNGKKDQKGPKRAAEMRAAS
ncbi:MAG: helix-turn-helix transcriptional regulator [Pseudonocardiaceae bacterium]